MMLRSDLVRLETHTTIYSDLIKTHSKYFRNDISNVYNLVARYEVQAIPTTDVIEAPCPRGRDQVDPG